MLNYLASGFTMLFPAFACIAILAVVAYASFKPDRQSPPAGIGMNVAMALPLQIGLYCALVLGSTLLYIGALTAVGMNPAGHPSRNLGGVYALVHKNSYKVLDDGLALSNDPRVPRWRAELPRSSPNFIMPLIRQIPVRGQASNLYKPSWTDRERSIDWTFSHDAMRFKGQDAQTGEERGWFGLHGAGDTQVFPAVPVMSSNEMIMTPQAFWVIDRKTKTLRQQLGVTGTEVFVAPVRKIAGSLDFSLTNQRLFAHPTIQNDSSPASVAWSIPLPGPLSNLDRVDIAKLNEGTLLSFDYGRAMASGAPGSSQTIMFVGTDGKAEIISRRLLTHDYPSLYEHREWWLSPLLQSVVSLKDIIFDRGTIPDQDDPWHTAELRYPRPPIVIAAAVLLAALSGLGAYRWLRSSALPTRGKTAWIVACALIGLPALFSLMALQPRPVRQARAQVAAAPRPALA
jgi:hypothetical protein